MEAKVHFPRGSNRSARRLIATDLQEVQSPLRLALEPLWGTLGYRHPVRDPTRRPAARARPKELGKDSRSSRSRTGRYAESEARCGESKKQRKMTRKGVMFSKRTIIGSSQKQVISIEVRCKGCVSDVH